MTENCTFKECDQLMYRGLPEHLRDVHNQNWKIILSGEYTRIWGYRGKDIEWFYIQSDVDIQNIMREKDFWDLTKLIEAYKKDPHYYHKKLDEQT